MVAIKFLRVEGLVLCGVGGGARVVEWVTLLCVRESQYNSPMCTGCNPSTALSKKIKKLKFIDVYRGGLAAFGRGENPVK